LDLVGGSQEDPLKAYVARLEERRASLPPPPPPRDKLDQLIAESRFGTATELFKHELKKKPADFDLWLRFAEVYGLHCGNVQTAERIVEQMDRSRRFSQDQIKLAWDKIKEWHARHSSQRGGW
jgi:thioredoxin-like negative regulator of GroEL